MLAFLSSMLGRVAFCAGLILLLAAPAARAQVAAPTWQTAVGITTGTVAGSGCYVRCTVVDSVGNVYLAGAFAGSATFGTRTLLSAPPSSGTVSDDLFVAKWSPSAGWLWVQQVGGSEYEYVNGLAVRGSSVYVTGVFASATATFGATTLTNASTNLSDIFVAKLTDAGSSSSWTWATRAGGIGLDLATDLAVRGNSLYITGDFMESAAFGATTLTTSGIGDIDVFVAKLTDMGTSVAWTWVQQVTGTNLDQVFAIAVEGNSLYIAGEFDSETATFGSSSLTSANRMGDGFVAKLTDAGTTGTWTWALAGGSPGIDGAKALAVQGRNVYVVGEFDGPTARFGPSTLTNLGSVDVFIAKITDAGATGAWTWARQAGGAGSDIPNTLVVRDSTLYVGGSFRDVAADFGPTTLPNVGDDDAFVCKLTDWGAFSIWGWAKRAGGSFNDDIRALVVRGLQLYVVGDFTGTALSLGPLTLFNPSGAFNATTFWTTLIDEPLATPALLPEGAVAFSPNPAATTASLRGAAPFAPVCLLDGLGRTVLLATTDADGTATLDVRTLPAGLYAVRGAGTNARRLVVAR